MFGVPVPRGGLGATPPLQVQRAAHPQPRPGHHVGIELRRGHGHMPEQVLERADVHAGFQQMSGKGMPQRVRCDALV